MKKTLKFDDVTSIEKRLQDQHDKGMREGQFGGLVAGITLSFIVFCVGVLVWFALFVPMYEYKEPSAQDNFVEL